MALIMFLASGDRIHACMYRSHYLCTHSFLPRFNTLRSHAPLLVVEHTSVHTHHCHSDNTFVAIVYAAETMCCDIHHDASVWAFARAFAPSLYPCEVLTTITRVVIIRRGGVGVWDVGEATV